MSKLNEPRDAMWPQFILINQCWHRNKTPKFPLLSPLPYHWSSQYIRQYNNEKYVSLFLYQYGAADPSSLRFEIGLFLQSDGFIQSLLHLQSSFSQVGWHGAAWYLKRICICNQQNQFSCKKKLLTHTQVDYLTLALSEICSYQEIYFNHGFIYHQYVQLFQLGLYMST